MVAADIHTIGDTLDMGARERIGAWIKEGCKQPGKSQRGLAERLGIDATGVNRLVHGRRKIDIMEIPIIIEYVGQPPPEIQTLLTKIGDSSDARRPKPAQRRDNVGKQGTEAMRKELVNLANNLPDELTPSAVQILQSLKSAWEAAAARPKRAG